MGAILGTAASSHAVSSKLYLEGRLTDGEGASVSGGEHNTAGGILSFVGGGGNNDPTYGNKAYGYLSTILGGFNNVTGESGNAAIGQYASITGGKSNIAGGPTQP